MKILIDNRWEDVFLDEALLSNTCRIRVLLWINVTRLRELYVERPKKLYIIWNYLKEIGIRNVIRKIISRKKETFRNQKFLSFGIGRVLSSHSGQFNPNQLVVFVAPCHPRCVERIVLDERLIKSIAESDTVILDNSKLFYSPELDISVCKELWDNISYWTPFSGDNIALQLDRIMSEAEGVVQRNSDLNLSRMITLDISTPTPIKEYVSANQSARNLQKKKKVVLFGLGNYAKTAILPNVSKHLQVSKIHEIDPTQIGRLHQSKVKYDYDTSPEPREQDEFDVYLIASFHHTHAPIAIHALTSGAYAVVEKPVVTTYAQLNDLLHIIKKSPKLFSGYHKRFSIFTQFAIEDIDAKKDTPISYHCIVYEEPLPKHHWYRWPNSHTRIVSNGCHWIDHFLFLNNFAPVSKKACDLSSNGEVVVNVELDNGAFFSMTLTDIGSQRIGVQNYIELRSRDVTVRIINDSYYTSENSKKIIRTKRINKLSNFRKMYSQIAAKIAKNEYGDSVESVVTSAKLILDLDQLLSDILETRKQKWA